jgi:predicted CoA-binding protein
MENILAISDELRDIILKAGSIAIWPIDINTLSESFQTARYFQDQGLKIYPIHDRCERILEEMCYRDIRLIPDDYDILLLFVSSDQLPEVVNFIFNADYMPPVIWTHVGVFDQTSYDRLVEAGVQVVMDQDLMDMHKKWTD